MAASIQPHALKHSAPPPPPAYAMHDKPRQGRYDGYKRDIDGFQNFLKHSAETALNVKTENDGSAIFEMKLDAFSTLIVVASSDEQSSHVIMPVGGNIVPQRDLSLLKSYDEEKSFSETRRAISCSKYDTFKIEDITSTEMQIIDSLNKVWLVQKELRKPSNEESEFVDTLIKWSTFD